MTARFQVLSTRRGLLYAVGGQAPLVSEKRRAGSAVYAVDYPVSGES